MQVSISENAMPSRPRFEALPTQEVRKLCALVYMFCCRSGSRSWRGVWQALFSKSVPLPLVPLSREVPSIHYPTTPLQTMLESS